MVGSATIIIEVFTHIAWSGCPCLSSVSSFLVGKQWAKAILYLVLVTVTIVMGCYDVYTIFSFLIGIAVIFTLSAYHDLKRSGPQTGGHETQSTLP